MARPSYKPGDKTARDRLADAFWELLAETPFADITARSVARRADVNHNTFYRYFDGVEGMARELFDESIVRDLPLAVLGKGSELPETPAPSLDPDGMRKALLYARSGSSLLTGILLDAVRSAWLDAAGVSLSELTPEQRMDCDIVFGGIVAAMADRELDMGAGAIADVLARPLGQGIERTLKVLAEGNS